MSNDWPGKFEPATEKMNNFESGENVTMFRESGILWCTGGERSLEWMYVEDMPSHLENRC